MKKNLFTPLVLAIALVTLTFSAYAGGGDTPAPAPGLVLGKIYQATASDSGFVQADKTNAWVGLEKIYVDWVADDGAIVKTSVQVAPPHRKNGILTGVPFSTAIRARVERHADGTIKRHQHPGLVIYLEKEKWAMFNYKEFLSNIPTGSAWYAEMQRLVDIIAREGTALPEGVQKDDTRRWTRQYN